MSFKTLRPQLLKQMGPDMEPSFKFHGMASAAASGFLACLQSPSDPRRLKSRLQQQIVERMEKAASRMSMRVAA